MPTKNGTKKRHGPQRPLRPNDKGLGGMPVLPLKLPRTVLDALRQRARYDTVHWRLEHGGQGHVVSAGDVARRILADYFERVSPLPDDAIGATVRAEMR
jgi:hypothetical protein